MKIVAIACARNEADIIESFVRHTLSYCQQLIITDHGSADDIRVAECDRRIAAENLGFIQNRSQN